MCPERGADHTYVREEGQVHCAPKPARGDGERLSRRCCIPHRTARGAEDEVRGGGGRRTRTSGETCTMTTLASTASTRCSPPRIATWRNPALVGSHSEQAGEGVDAWARAGGRGRGGDKWGHGHGVCSLHLRVHALACTCRCRVCMAKGAWAVSETHTARREAGGNGAAAQAPGFQEAVV